MRGIASICLCVLLASGASAAGAAAPPAPPPTLTLADAQRQALAAHPDIKASDFDVAAAELAIQIARSAYSPQAGGSVVQAVAGPGTRIAAPGALNDPTIIQRTSLGIAVQQYVTDFGRTANAVASLEYSFKAQAAQGTLTRQAILLSVTQAYFEVLRAQALAVVARQTLDTRQTLLKQVTVLQRAGLRSLLDVSIASRDVSSAQQLVLVSRQGIDDAYAALSEAMGMPDVAVYRLQPPATLPVTPDSVGPYMQRAIVANPELQALDYNALAAQKHAVSVGKESSPTIEAYGYVGGTPVRADNQPINQTYSAAGVVMNVPILNGGAIAAARRQAEDEAAAAAARAEAGRNRVARDVQQAYSGVEEAHGNMDVAEQLLRTAKQAYALTAARYRIGLNSIVDLSDAQLNETQAAISRSNALYDYIEREAALEFVSGVLAPRNP